MKTIHTMQNPTSCPKS